MKNIDERRVQKENDKKKQTKKQGGCNLYKRRTGKD